jgi:hypothetical protein
MSQAPTDSDVETYYRVGDSVALRLIKGGVITGKVLTADDAPVGRCQSTRFDDSGYQR